MSGKYDEIIDLPHYEPRKHSRMSSVDRAAQFSPFAALTGYGALLDETKRLTDQKVELDESEKEVLDEKLRLLMERAEEHPEVSITYFQPDEYKDGGAYLTVCGVVRRIDELRRCLVLEDRQTILVERVVDIGGALFQCWDL